MANMRWFLLDTTHPGYVGALINCRTRLDILWKKNILSIILSDDGTRALVKSDSMGIDYRRGKWAEKVQGGGLMKDIYDRSDHHKALKLLSGRAWSNTRSDII